MRRAAACVFVPTLVCRMVIACLLVCAARDARALTPADELALAQAFAPTFLYHPDESLFPISPFDDSLSQAADVGPEDSSAQLLEARIRAYDRQPLSWRLLHAAVFFRVVPVPSKGVQSHYRLEYWVYYVANRYRLVGGAIPFRADGNHPHDLEHVFLTVESLTPDATTPDQFWLREVWGSAHDGSSMSNNHFAWSSFDSSPKRVRMIVELGSHAMAPDVDLDGRFTVTADSNGDRTFIWGIRDHGRSWSRYRADYADPRPEGVALELRPASSGGRSAECDGRACGTYVLRQAAALGVNESAAHTLVRATQDAYARKRWVARAFGDVDIRQLIAPPDLSTQAAPMADQPARTERGIAVGFTPVLSPATGFVSGRFAFNLGSGYAPKAMVNTTMLVLPNRTLGEVDVSAWYPLDTVTKLLIGVQARTDLFTWAPNRTSAYLGAEFRLGRWRWRILARDGRNQAPVEFKMYYFVWPR